MASRSSSGSWLDPSRVGRDAGKITEEILQYLAMLPDAEVDVKLKIHIRVPDSIDDRRIRAVSENATALKLTSSNFKRH